MRKGVRIFLYIILLTITILGRSTVSAKETNCTVSTFIKELAISLNLANSSNTAEECLAQLISKEVIVEADEINLGDSKIRIDDCCVIFDRVLNYLNEKPNTKSYELIERYKRISDLKKIDKVKRTAVIRCFSEGIISSTSNGEYVQSIKVDATSYILLKEAKACIARLNNKDKRYLMSEDGQKIRTRNLPQNAEDFPYILEAYPNEFYEVMFDFMNYNASSHKQTKNRMFKNAIKDPKCKKDGNTYYSTVSLHSGDYSTPVNVRGSLSGLYDFFSRTPYYEYFPFDKVMQQNLYDWCDIIEEYVRLKYNVDYRTIDKAWINRMSELTGSSGFLNEYKKGVKSNKVIIKLGKVAIEPSTCYDSNGTFIRAYIKFKIVSAKSLNDLSKVFYRNFNGSANINYKSLQIGKWKEIIVDFSIGTSTGSFSILPASYYSIFNDSASDYYMSKLMQAPVSGYKQVKIKSGENKGYYKWVQK